MNLESTTCDDATLFDADRYIPLATFPLADPPLGHIRLVEPLPLPDGHGSARWLENELRRRRDLLQVLLEAGDVRIRQQQALEFAFLTCRLMWQRFRLQEFVHIPTATIWLDRLKASVVIERARTLFEQQRDVLLVFAPDLEHFELSGPRSRARHLADAIVVSLTPVFESLAIRGLWVRTDAQLEDLARTLIALARSQARHVEGQVEGGAH